MQYNNKQRQWYNIHVQILHFQKNEFPVNLSFDAITFCVTMTLKQNYQIDLTKSNFNELIGFEKKSNKR